MNTPSPTLSTRLYHYFCFRLPLYLLVIAMGYVLSIGPMFWYWHEAVSMGTGREYILQVYYPLAFICTKNEFIANVFDWYINLWIS